ncbi:hypothetical protein OUZ56_012714 [Daphnia magna]|uniref:Uncharacterized protein n=1 Tax=Daphnia magna TaxID=35525 RepID=A0ABQ9Z3V4_9CRUS|nr:hypothetical protein OUZ56_012714 [Daphnia magna]
MAYHLPSPVGVAVKLSPVGPLCMLLSSHFLSLTIRQHSKGCIEGPDPERPDGCVDRCNY